MSYIYSFCFLLDVASLVAVSSVQRLPECCSHFDRHAEDIFAGMSGKHAEYPNVSGCVIPGKVAQEGTVVTRSCRSTSEPKCVYSCGRQALGA